MACLASPSMSEESFEAEPSTPSPTGTPRSSISRTRAMPEPSLMLEEGQWATPVLVRARSLSSSSSKKMPCAYQTSFPTRPQSSISLSGLRP